MQMGAVFLGSTSQLANACTIIVIHIQSVTKKKQNIRKKQVVIYN